MMELTGYPSNEFDLGKWHKYVQDGGPGFEDMILHRSFDVYNILCTWNEKTTYKHESKRFPLKAHSGPMFETIKEGGFPVGCHTLVKCIKYTKEDGSEGKMCMLGAPNGTGNTFRENGWNLDRYPSLTEE
jgi:hypothetical protein